MIKLKRLLFFAILAPSIFLVLVVGFSYFSRKVFVFTYEQEHLAMVLVMLAGIIPFSFFMFRIFRRIQSHILHQNEQLARQARETEALLKVGRTVEQSMDMDQVIPAALEAILEATTGEAAEVWLVDQPQGVVHLRYHEGEAKEAFAEITRLSIGEGYPGMVAQIGKPILTHSLPNDATFLRHKVKAEGFQTFYTIPLRRGESTIGVLTVAARDPEALTSEDERRLLDLMAEHIAVAVENAQLHEEVQTLAVTTERERLAREMHDGLVQVLGYVNTKAQAVKELLKTGQVETAVQQMEQLEAAAQETYDDVREAILALGINGKKRPFMESLREYLQRFSDLAELPAQLEVEGTPFLQSPRIEVQLLRIIQEALANTRKHARATRARVLFAFNASGCRLVIEDDGRGFDPARLAHGPWPQMGLQSMRERASSVGGRFILDTAPDRGTRVIVDISRPGE
ncbi:MAG: GAF domain-containing sensor histidine kinase [Chloroflexi bacterium]|nr:GAF domain-containing sensor histidine kinase [Chloroflexota bacterium]MBI3040267.1 GAF domain-containing sensor histidine kinase [Chloroflexota bacterium]